MIQIKIRQIFWSPYHIVIIFPIFFTFLFDLFENTAYIYIALNSLKGKSIIEM
jgi:hypothetical protein